MHTLVTKDRPHAETQPAQCKRRQAAEATAVPDTTPSATEALGPAGKASVQNLSTYQTMLDASPPVQRLIRLQTAARPSPVQAVTALPHPLQKTTSGIVQYKQYFSPNHQSMALPGDKADDFREHALDTVARQAVHNLADGATLQDAQAAINLAAQNDFVMPGENLGFQWVGAKLYLIDTNTNARLDLLGTVLDEQDPALYLDVDTGTASHLKVNKDTGEERVLDAADRFIPRTIDRSITVPERTNLRNRQDLSPRSPNAGLNPLEHVAGGQNSQYTSYTRSDVDVLNSHGVPFNAGGTGRITIDLLNVDKDNILDLSTHEGIRAHLRPHLPHGARDIFDDISSDAKEKAQDELANGIDETAGSDNPHSAVLTDQRWQALVDAYRTQEVLVQGDVPFAAVTDFREFNGVNPLTDLAQQEITNNQGTFAGHSDTGQQALHTHHNTQVTLGVNMQTDLGKVERWLSAKKEEYLFKNKASGVPNAKARNTVFRQTMQNDYMTALDEVRQVARAYQSRANDGWANSARGDAQAALLAKARTWVTRLGNVAP